MGPNRPDTTAINRISKAVQLMYCLIISFLCSSRLAVLSLGMAFQAGEQLCEEKYFIFTRSCFCVPLVFFSFFSRFFCAILIHLIFPRLNLHKNLILDYRLGDLCNAKFLCLFLHGKSGYCEKSKHAEIQI